MDINFNKVDDLEGWFKIKIHKGDLEVVRKITKIHKVDH